MRKKLKILATVALCGGAVWFALPLLKLAFTLGTIFGELICFSGLLIIWLYKPLCKRGIWWRRGLRVLAAGYVLGIFWCVYLTAMMFSVLNLTPPENTNVILLGAKVEWHSRPSLTLQGRIDEAYVYLVENPEAVIIVTGGQGSNEPIAEAEAERTSLIEMGIEESRIYVEDQSTTTEENLQFALEIAEANGLGTEFALVSQEFHIYRAMQMAEQIGITPYCLAADSDPFLFPCYYGRELLALTVWKLSTIF